MTVPGDTSDKPLGIRSLPVLRRLSDAYGRYVLAAPDGSLFGPFPNRRLAIRAAGDAFGCCYRAVRLDQAVFRLEPIWGGSPRFTCLVASEARACLVPGTPAAEPDNPDLS